MDDTSTREELLGKIEQLEQQVALFQVSERKRVEKEQLMRKNLDAEYAHTEKQLKQLTQQILTVQETERRRISQDLHDDIGQGMTALILRLNAIQNRLPPELDELRGELYQAIQDADALTSQIRQLAYQLRPPALDSMPLARALDSLCSLFGPQSGLTVHYSSDPELPPIPMMQAIVLYRFVQEGLNNIVRHASAHSAWVSLDYADGEVALSIEDDGQGFEPQAVAQGMGLQGIRDRFLTLNGVLNIDSAPGRGAHLYGALPLTDHRL
ncbi:MAG: sensor histidine kinase [Anaerolineae bacterium]